MHRALRRIYIAGGLFFLAALCTALLSAEYLRVHGAIITVTNTNDSGPGSLRQAIVDAGDGDTIQFDPALNGQGITLTSAELVIDNSITITGPGPALLSVSRDQQASNFRIFRVPVNRTVLISGLTISNGQAESGAGIYNDGTLSVVNTTVSGNSTIGAGIGGGGISNQGSLTIIQSTISGNSEPQQGGGILNSGTLMISDSSVSDNRSMGSGHYGGSGGGIWNSGAVTIQNTSINGNMAIGEGGGGGGGIFNSGSLTATNCTIRGNTSIGGGGIFGGATIINCTISSNTSFGSGSAIFGNGTISNSTISDNTANQTGGNGLVGGFIITNSTISNNSGNQGYNIFTSSAVELGNTILKAGPSGVNIGINGGNVTSHGYNLSSDNGGGFLTGPGDQINTEPLLGPLQNNGGPTFTHELLTGSPAINSGDPNFSPPPVYDQRGNGYPRVFDGRIDIGSFEVQSVQPTPTATATTPPTASPTPSEPCQPHCATPTPTISPTPTPSATATVTPTPSCHPLITQSTSQEITTGALPCLIPHPPPGGNITVDTSYWRAFDMATFSAENKYFVHSVSFGVNSAADNHWVRIRLYANNGGAFPGGSRTEIASRVVELAAVQSGTVVTASLQAVVPAETEQLVMEVFSPASPNELWLGANTAPETGLSYWNSACTGMMQIPMNMHLVFNVYGSCAAQALNFSTRLHVGTGDEVAIGGFIMSNAGFGFDQIVVRALGPSIGQQGVPDYLPDPYLELHDSSGTVISHNDNWQDDPEQATELTNVGLAPTNDLESGLIATVQPGVYTAVIKGNNGQSGTGLVEIYNLNPNYLDLANISTRGLVEAGDNVMIGGFIVAGPDATDVAVRGLGPALAQFGIANPLADPTLELRDSNGNLLVSNDNWQDDPASAVTLATYGLGLPNSSESGIYTSISVGAYTAILAGKDGGTGAGLVEIYNLQ